MKVVLDTHAMLWWWSDPQRLPSAVLSTLSSQETEIFASAVCAYEMACKHHLGKLHLPAGLLRNFQQAIIEEGWITLPVSLEHCLLAGRLEADHRDPFDRLLAAQAILEKAFLVTVDPAFSAFQRLKTHWT